MIENMDPIMKAWMFYSWAEDYTDQYKMLENQGYLIGGLINPEFVQKVLGKGSQTFSSTDEEFEDFTNKMFSDTQKEYAEKYKNTKRRKRKNKIIG